VRVFLITIFTPVQCMKARAQNQNKIPCSGRDVVGHQAANKKGCKLF